MSELIIILAQIIIGLFAFSFLTYWLAKTTQNRLLAASLMAAFVLIWTDAGGLARAAKIGAWEFIIGLILDIFTYGLFFFIAYCLTLPNQEDK